MKKLLLIILIPFLGNFNSYSQPDKTNYGNNPDDADWDPTSFGFDLEELDGNIQLKFWHVGWPECNANFKRSSFCWAMLLNGLKNYLEKGLIVPFEERA